MQVTVEDLIEILKKFDQKSNVVFNTEDDQHFVFCGICSDTVHKITDIHLREES